MSHAENIFMIRLHGYFIAEFGSCSMGDVLCHYASMFLCIKGDMTSSMKRMSTSDCLMMTCCGMKSGSVGLNESEQVLF